MPKIISFDNEKVLIGTDDGKIKEVKRENVKYVPIIGDNVEIFENENETIVIKSYEEIENKTENRKRGNILAIISLILIFVPNLIYEMILKSSSSSSSHNILSSILELLPLAGILIMIIGRITYPSNIFLKFVMWIIIFLIGSVFLALASCAGVAVSCAGAGCL